MFVLVMPYREKDLNFTGKAPIYDTEDLTLEYVDIKEAIASGLTIEGYYNRNAYYATALYDALRYTKSSGNTGIKISSLTKDMINYSINGVAVKVDEVVLMDDIDLALEINGERVCICASSVMSYAFKYSDFYILRFKLTEYDGHSNAWFSVAVDETGVVVSYWDEFLKHAKNKAFALKVDMIGGV